MKHIPAGCIRNANSAGMESQMIHASVVRSNNIKCSIISLAALEQYTKVTAAVGLYSVPGQTCARIPWDEIIN